MLTFYGQPEYSTDNDKQTKIGYELLLRDFVDGHCVVPQDFCTLSATALRTLIEQAIAVTQNEVSTLSLNLEESQFVDSEFQDMLIDLQSSTKMTLYIELTERYDSAITIQQIIKATRRFAEAQMQVSVDDVGTGANKQENVMCFMNWVTELKFAFQNFRPITNYERFQTTLKFWYSLAIRQHKEFVIEGVENNSELAWVLKDFPEAILQGYYIGKPVPLLKL